MRITIGSLFWGWLLCVLLMIKLPFLFAWLSVVGLGLLLEVYTYRNENLQGQLSYWTIIGSMIPIYFMVIREMFKM